MTCFVGPDLVPHFSLASYVLYNLRESSTHNALASCPAGFQRIAQFCWMVSPLVESELEKMLVNISAVIKTIESRIIDVTQALQVEVSSLSQVTVQNSMALDLL